MFYCIEKKTFMVKKVKRVTVYPTFVNEMYYYYYYYRKTSWPRFTDAKTDRWADSSKQKVWKLSRSVSVSEWCGWGKLPSWFGGWFHTVWLQCLEILFLRWRALPRSMRRLGIHVHGYVHHHGEFCTRSWLAVMTPSSAVDWFFGRKAYLSSSKAGTLSLGCYNKKI